MIVIETTKIYVLYVRTNRRVKWRYAEYGGRYESFEKALDAAKQHFGDTPFEYHVENLENEEIITGFVNWKNPPKRKK